jgi:hypothetical protein
VTLFKNYIGPWTIDPGERLYDLVRDIIISTDALNIAAEAILLGKAKGTDAAPFEILSGQFRVRILLPNGLLKWAIAPERPHYGIVIRFDRYKVRRSNREWRSWDTDGPQGATENLFIGAFLLFYARHSDWISSKWPLGASTYPDVIRFGWMMRNSLAHHNGRCRLGDPTIRCSWHHLSFSAADSGCLIWPRIIGVGEILLLMIEMGVELDALQCPTIP